MHTKNGKMQVASSSIIGRSMLIMLKKMFLVLHFPYKFPKHTNFLLYEHNLEMGSIVLLFYFLAETSNTMNNQSVIVK